MPHNNYIPLCTTVVQQPVLVDYCCFHLTSGASTAVCVLGVVIPFILDVRFVDVPAGDTQEEGHIGFLHLPSAVLALIFLARRIQPFLFLVDREVEFLCTERFNRFPLVGHFLFFYCIFL